MNQHYRSRFIIIEPHNLCNVNLIVHSKLYKFLTTAKVFLYIVYIMNYLFKYLRSEPYNTVWYIINNNVMLLLNWALFITIYYFFMTCYIAWYLHYALCYLKFFRHAIVYFSLLAIVSSVVISDIISNILVSSELKCGKRKDTLVFLSILVST